jgi:hypothetical protein
MGWRVPEYQRREPPPGILGRVSGDDGTPDSAEDERLTRVSALCAALPEAVREPAGRHATFRVRRRPFAYFLDDHHGDGVVGVVVRAPWGEREGLIRGQPERFYDPAYVGPRGWIGVRLDTEHVDWPEVADLVLDSYRVTAPKRLAALVPVRENG